MITHVLTNGIHLSLCNLMFFLLLLLIFKYEPVLQTWRLSMTYRRQRNHSFLLEIRILRPGVVKVLVQEYQQKKGELHMAVTEAIMPRQSSM